MAKIIDSSYLKVTVGSNDMVWVIDGDRMPKYLGIYVDNFIEDLASCGKHKFIRVIASENNHSIITKLYKLKLSKAIDSLQLATPALSQKDRPASSLMRMRLCTLPPSLGGWHEMTDDDYVIYAMARLMFFYNNVDFKKKKDGSYTVKSQKEIEKITEYVTSMITKLPLWNYVSFVDGVDPIIMANIITSICDPRWFIDAERPERMSRLFSRMGLSGHGKSEIKSARASSLKACWLGNYVDYKHDSSIVSKMVKDPSYFMIKYAYDKWGPDDNNWEDNNVSKRFLKFIKLSWLDCIYPFPNPWMEPLFNYSEFFNDNVALSAFLKRIKK